jgi:hypothetical protein
MPRGEPRRFNLGDAMILVAASALGLVVMPALLDGWRYGVVDDRLAQFARPDILHQLIALLAWASTRLGLILLPMLAAWTLAFVLLRLRRPRPAPRRMARQAGMITCSAAVLGMALAVAEMAIVGAFAGFAPGRQLLWLLSAWLRGTAPQVGMAVAAARLAHATILGRRPADDAIDRLGRWLGWLWVALVPILGWTVILEVFD